MNLFALALRGLRYHARLHLGALLGATVAAGILAGALAVGDSVRYSLRQMALSRIGRVETALVGRTRFFRADLAGPLSRDLSAPTAPALLLPGTLVAQGQGGAGPEMRAGRVSVIGADSRFWKLAPGGDAGAAVSSDGAVVNERLARLLRLRPGDDILLRVDKPSLLSRDAPLSKIEDSQVTIRLPVAHIASDEEFGRFSLEANQAPPLNVYVPLARLQREAGVAGRANTLLVGARRGNAVQPAEASSALWRHWELADAGLQVRRLDRLGLLELRTDRVFLDPAVSEAALRAYPGRAGVLTYFVNSIEAGGRSTPYSTVAALEEAPVPQGMADDEILVNRWLADDLGVKPGGVLTLRYWTVGPMRKLVERTAQFRIRSVLPLAGAALDPDLMPPIPGLSDKKNCRNWEPGVPIDLKRIRDKDQDYWSKYRGAPKAFITLRAGQRIWENRFGDLTAVRYAMRGQDERVVEACIKQALNPAAMGVFFQPVRQQALAASSPAFDFGQLFLGFSTFLIVAALILTALLFAFGVEQRAAEMGTLLAVGLPARLVRRLLLVEGAGVALLSAVAGAALAALYTRVVVRALGGVWSGAVGGSELQYHVEPATLAAGAAAGFAAAMLSIWLVARKQGRLPARDLLAGTQAAAPPETGRRRVLPGLPTAIVAGALGAALTGLAMAQGAEKGAESFFGAGALLLLAVISACMAALAALETRHESDTRRASLTRLAVRNAARRRSRSLAAIAMLACGAFLVIAVGANRQDANRGAERRGSGTGGFALYGETTLPVYQDLNTNAARESLGIDPAALANVRIVQLRLREGDDASCLNLNRAQSPRLLGVEPERLAERGAFTFTSSQATDSGSPWRLLDAPARPDEIPAIGDSNTVTWALGKGLGDTVPYVDERGATRRLRIVGVIGNSVLQGALIVSERNFIRMFPSESGYRVFLVDAKSPSHAGGELTRAMQDAGLTLLPAAERLAAFNMVENTYLSIFAALGGLGLILGSVGLGVVVLRNVLERRAEFAILRAVGLPVRMVQKMVFAEHGLLLVMGVLAGVAAGLVAVLPSLRGEGAPVLFVAGLVVIVLASGALWVALATAAALRGPLLESLRRE